MPPSDDATRRETATTFDVAFIAETLLAEAEARRQEAAQEGEIEAEAARRRAGLQAIRAPLNAAFYAAYRFPAEENEQGRTACQDGYNRWAELIIKAGELLRQCDDADDGFHLVEKIRTAAVGPAPGGMRLACMLLAMAAEERLAEVAAEIQSAYVSGDIILCKFYGWFPWILDAVGMSDDPIHPRPPVTLEEESQAWGAFGRSWRVLMATGNDPLRIVASTDAPSEFASSWTADDAEACREDAAPIDDAPAEPAPLLFGWTSIFSALNGTSTEEGRRQIGRLNASTDGPIISTGQGAQPMVNKDKLLAWWNGLEERFREIEQRKTDQKASVDDQYDYAREGAVVPGIGGHVKARRKKDRT